MKKFSQSFLSTVLALLMFSAQTMAYTSNASTIISEDEVAAVIDFDELEIYGAFDEINELVSTIERSDVSYSDLETTNSNLLTNVSSSAAIAMNSTSEEEPPIIGAFWWGCLTGLLGFGLVGVIVVYITTKDSNQTWEAIGGCLVGGCLTGSSYYFFLGYSSY